MVMSSLISAVQEFKKLAQELKLDLKTVFCDFSEKSLSSDLRISSKLRCNSLC